MANFRACTCHFICPECSSKWVAVVVDRLCRNIELIHPTAKTDDLPGQVVKGLGGRQNRIALAKRLICQNPIGPFHRIAHHLAELLASIATHPNLFSSLKAQFVTSIANLARQNPGHCLSQNLFGDPLLQFEIIRQSEQEFHQMMIHKGHARLDGECH